MSDEWISEEFKKLPLGDKKLDKRFVKTMNILSNRPEDSINRAIGDWKDKKAAYRLFAHSECDSSKILQCHSNQTKERMKGHKVVLSIHDSTYFGFSSKRSIEGLGNIGGSSWDKDGEQIESHGFIGHYALAVSEEGLPLGVQGVKYWSRHYESPWEKESERWGELCDEVEELYSPETQMIYVADREADQFELLYQAVVDKTDFVIRSKANRLIQGKDYYLQWNLDKKQSVKNTIIYVPARKGEVEVSIKCGEVSFNNPKVQKAKHLERKGIRSVKLNVVEVKEIGNLTKDALRWVLFTSLEVNNEEDALKIVSYYRQRWHIENYFKVLKGGCCKVENCCLKSFEKLERYVAAFSILAWRLYWCRHMNSIEPEAPAETILSPAEREVIRRKIKKRNNLPGVKKIIPDIVTVRDAIRYIASLGGFNGRKGDGEPGIITLWRGFIILQDKAETLEEIYDDLKLSYQ
jgi:IS4 transposase